MTKHTPGPWRIAQQSSPFPWVIESELREDEIAHAPINSGNTHAEDQANARLIAAAPDLLEALEAVVASASPHPVEHPAMTKAWGIARAAIAKVR